MSGNKIKFLLTYYMTSYHSDSGCDISIKKLNILFKTWNINIIDNEWWGRGAEAQSVTRKSTGCGFDSHSRKWNLYLHLYLNFFALVSRQSAALNSTTQHTMPPELGGKWGTECLNTRFPLPSLLCAGYSVKLIYLFIF